MTRHMRFALALLIAATAGCATMTVGLHVDRTVNLAQYRTWDWAPADSLPAADARLADNGFLKDYLEGAVETRLTSLGFLRAPKGLAPDLLIHYHGSVSERFLVNESAVDCVPGDCQPQTIAYEQGTLVLDILERRLDRLVWRGWAQDALPPFLSDQDRMKRQVNEAVARLFAEFPNSF